MRILLDDIPYNDAFFPFAQLRSCAHLRVGILSIFEKWNALFPGNVFIKSELPADTEDYEEISVFPANFIPSFNFLKEYREGRIAEPDYRIHGKSVTRPWQLFECNDWAIREDFYLVTHGRESAKIPAGIATTGTAIFIEEGAEIHHSVLNANTGPIYIGKGAEVMEGCLLRGPVSIGANSILKMGTKIYGATTIGPDCVAGGEIKNSIMMRWSNKGHDGYLGDSVLEEWCNLGAGTSTSNLKNNASPVRVWSEKEEQYIEAGNKCGLLMGSYSKSAINTAFNTGTVVGISSNVFGSSFPSKYIPNFTWGNEVYHFEKIRESIENWRTLKGLDPDPNELERLHKLYKKQIV